MISLQVESYCQDCSKFEPECSKISADNRTYMTLISCANRDLCANLKQYIEGQMVGKTLKDIPTSPLLDPKYKGEPHGQKGETSTTKDQAAEQLHSPGETVEGSHPGDGS